MAAIHGLLHEYVQQRQRHYPLYTPSPTERGETMVMKVLNDALLKIGHPVNIRLGKWTFGDIVGVNKVFGTPKADLALVAWRQNRLVNVGFISHKLGQTARDFQQYSGITPDADGKRPGAISRDPRVVSFLRDLSQPGRYKAVVKDKERFYRPIQSSTLMGKSVYGPEFGSPTYSIDNVHGIGQGTPFLVKADKTHYTCRFSAGFHPNGDTTHFTHGDYKGVIGARYTEGRRFQVDGKTFNNIRVLILPHVVLGLGPTVHEL